MEYKRVSKTGKRDLQFGTCFGQKLVLDATSFQGMRNAGSGNPELAL